MSSARTVKPAEKEAMIAHGTWGLFVAKRKLIASETGCTSRQAAGQIMEEFLPKPGDVPPLNVKRPSLQQSEKQLSSYEADRADRTFNSAGQELIPPGDERLMDKVTTVAPGDFDGGDMGDFIVNDNVEFEGSQLDGESLKWVVANIGNDKIKLPAQAPNSSSWTILVECRNNSTFREKVLLSLVNIVAKKMMNQVEEPEDDGFDGEDLVDILAEVRILSAESKKRFEVTRAIEPEPEPEPENSLPEAFQ